MATDAQVIKVLDIFLPLMEAQDDLDFYTYQAEKALDGYDASRTDEQYSTELEARGYTVSKRIAFNIDNESTWPKFCGETSKECDVSEVVLDQLFNKVKLIKFNYTPSDFEKETKPYLVKQFVDADNGNELEYIVTHWQSIPDLLEE